MTRRPPRSTRTDTLFPYTTLFRSLPEVALYETGRNYRRLIAMTKDLAPIRTAVVHPVDAPSLLGAVEAAKAGLILPVLVGPEAKIRAAAAQAALDLAPYEIVPTEHSDAAAVDRKSFV